MFKTAQEYIALIVTRDFVQAALIEVANKTAEIKLFAETLLEEGIVEDGVIYHQDGLTDAIKQCVNQLNVKGKPKVWLAIPDNKVIISLSDSLKDIEKKYDIPQEDLASFKVDNGVNALKKENLDGYIYSVQQAGFTVTGAFPIASCVYGTLKKVIAEDSLILYPFESSKLKFFIVNDKGITLNSVHGLNTIVKNRDLEKGINEIETFASNEGLLKKIDKIIYVANDDSEDLSDMLPHYDLSYIKRDQEEIENFPFLIIKGLIKKINTQQKGFLSANSGKSAAAYVPIPAAAVTAAKATKIEDIDDREEISRGKSIRLGIVATVLTLLVLVLIGILIYALLNAHKSVLGDDVSSVTPVPTVNNAPTATPLPTATPTPLPTPTAVPYETYSVVVLNGNGIVGDSEKVRQFLISKGFKNVQRDNAANFDYTSTIVSIKSTADSAGDYVVSLLTGSYKNVTKKTAPAAQTSDIVITLGAK